MSLTKVNPTAYSYLDVTIDVSQNTCYYATPSTYISSDSTNLITESTNASVYILTDCTGSITIPKYSYLIGGVGTGGSNQPSPNFQYYGGCNGGHGLFLSTCYLTTLIVDGGLAGSGGGGGVGQYAYGRGGNGGLAGGGGGCYIANSNSAVGTGGGVYYYYGNGNFLTSVGYIGGIFVGQGNVGSGGGGGGFTKAGGSVETVQGTIEASGGAGSALDNTLPLYGGNGGEYNADGYYGYRGGGGGGASWGAGGGGGGAGGGNGSNFYGGGGGCGGGLGGLPYKPQNQVWAGGNGGYSIYMVGTCTITNFYNSQGVYSGIGPLYIGVGAGSTSSPVITNYYINIESTTNYGTIYNLGYAVYENYPVQITNFLIGSIPDSFLYPNNTSPITLNYVLIGNINVTYQSGTSSSNTYSWALSGTSGDYYHLTITPISPSNVTTNYIVNNASYTNKDLGEIFKPSATSSGITTGYKYSTSNTDLGDSLLYQGYISPGVVTDYKVKSIELDGTTYTDIDLGNIFVTQ